MKDFYTDLHRHPELSFHENRTAEKIADELRSSGFEVTHPVGGTGLVGVLKNGKGPTVMLRTDLDALPVKEQTGLPYASTRQVIDDLGKTVDVMHACGHDVHMTVFVGTARQLVRLKDRWQGTLILVGQPAEERGAGARMMLEDGLFDRFPRPDFNLALHVSPDLPVGTVGYTKGYAFANVDSVDIAVHGIGGHGAYPHRTKDPVVLAAKIVLSLQTLVSREVSPLDPAVVTVGSIHGGTKHNIISDRVDLQLTVRSYSNEVKTQLLEGIKRIALAEARAYGLPDSLLPTVKIKNEATPSLYNDPQFTSRMVDVFERTFGKERVTAMPPVMGGEDFARYGRVEPKIPSLMFRLGAVDSARLAKAKEKGEQLPSLHSPFFAPVPEPTIKTGVLAMTSAALELLAK
ncbi:MAG: putative amidohydrolase [Nitrospinaceae bacterium]|nr:MAG: putative amidohydrolase [Nitrospinaceae bacterium]